MSSKLPINSQYLDNSEKCKIIQEHLITACRYYIVKIDQNRLNLGVCKLNWSYLSFYSTGVHSDISKAQDLIAKLESHIDAQALKPILKTIPNDSGNFHANSMKVILARSFFDIINMNRPDIKDKLLFHWNDPNCNQDQVDLALNYILKWIDGPVTDNNYRSYLNTIDHDKCAAKYQD